MNYFYIRDENNVPVGCVGWYVSASNSVAFAISVCAKSDKFTKARAKYIVNERIRLKKMFVLGVNNTGNGRVMRSIMDYIASSKNTQFPRSAIANAKLWLKTVPDWDK